MAKKIQIDIEVNGKMQKATMSTKKLRDALDGVDEASKKTSKSQGQLDRNIKGTANVSANATKNFSKMSQGMGGLVGVYATIAAQVFAVTAAFQFFKSAVDFSNLIKGQEALGAATGIAYKTITKGIQDATDAQLGYAEAARAAAIGTSAGLSPSQLTELGRAAKNASIALGRDLGDSFDRLVRGVVKAEPEVLDELGIILRLAPATEKYAESIGKAASELTAFERSQAVANEVLGQAEEKFGLIEAQLDPSVAALNQFIKAFDDIKKTIFTSIAEPIATVATFLSKNLFALVGLLGVFGLSIARSILPNLHHWKKDSQEVIDINKGKLGELRAELDLTRKKYIEVNATQAGLGKGKALIEGQSGGKAPTKGALGFIAGGTNDKRAAQAARRALDRAETDLNNSVKKRTGILRKFSAEEIKILRETFIQREALLKSGEVSFNRSIQGNKLKLKELGLSFSVLKAQASSFFATMSAKAAGLMAAFGWISLLVSLGSILIGFVSSIKDYLNGVDSAQKSVNEQVEQTTEKYKTLNEEILRSQSFLANNPVTGTTQIMAEAGQVQSLDVSTIIKDVNRLTDPRVANSENFKQLQEEMINTATAAAKLSPAFNAVSKAVAENRKLTEGEVLVLEAVARAMGSVKTAFEQAAAVTDTTNTLVRKFIDTIKKPFASELTAQVEEELSSLGIQATALRGKLAEPVSIPVDDAEMARTQKILDETFDAKRFTLEFDKAGKAIKVLRNEGLTGYKNDVTNRKASQDALEQYNQALAEQGARRNQLNEDAEAARKKTEEQLTQITDREVYLGNIRQATSDVAEENNTRLTKQRQILEDVSKFRTNGLNAAEKIRNLALDQVKSEQDLVPLQNKQAVQQALISNLEAKKLSQKGKLSDVEEAQLENARQGLEATNFEVGLLQDRNKLQAQLNPILAARLVMQEKIKKASEVNTEIQARQKISAELQREFNIRKQIFAVQEKMAKDRIDMDLSAQEIANPFFDKERAQAEKQLQLETNNRAQKQIQIQSEYDNKVAAINLEYELLDAQKESQALRLEALAAEVKVRDGAGTALEKSLRDQATSFRGINYAGAKDAALSLALAHKQAAELGLKKTEQDARNAVIALQPISKILDDSAESFSTALTDSFTTIFDSLTDKTMDLKEALKSIGRSFVSSLQKSLVENMLVGPLTEKIGQVFSKFKLKERLFGTQNKEGTPDVSTGTDTGALTSIGEGLDGKGLGTTRALLVRLESGTSTLPSGAAQAAADGENVVVAGGGSPPETKAVKEQTEATEQNTMATTQAGLQTASAVTAGLATVAALTGNEKAAKALAIVTAILQTAIIGLTMATNLQTAGNIFGFRRGGVASPNMYSTGGIAKGSHAGYPAVLHGTEAVVPLPNGKSIPVDMGGAAGMQQNNVNVNVVVNRDGTAETNSEQDSREAAKLGKNIARAVQTEIQNQKRAGGMLSPYGAL
jgi:hypothetical protein